MVREDCFGFDIKKRQCRVLNATYCRNEDCKFYKTKEQRCRECRESKIRITCEECKERGWM